MIDKVFATVLMAIIIVISFIFIAEVMVILFDTCKKSKGQEYPSFIFMCSATILGLTLPVISIILCSAKILIISGILH